MRPKLAHPIRSNPIHLKVCTMHYHDVPSPSPPLGEEAWDYDILEYVDDSSVSNLTSNNTGRPPPSPSNEIGQPNPPPINETGRPPPSPINEIALRHEIGQPSLSPINEIGRLILPPTNEIRLLPLPTNQTRQSTTSSHGPRVPSSGVSPGNPYLTGVRGRGPRLENMNQTSVHTIMHAGHGWSPGDGIPRNARIDPVPQNSRNNPPVPQNSRINPPVPQNSRINPPVPRNLRINPPVPQNLRIDPQQALIERAATLRNSHINTERNLTQDVAIDEADVDVNGSQDGLAEPGEPDIEPQMTDIHINYLFHIVQALNQPPTNPRARKQKAGTSSATDDLPKTMKVEAKDNKIIISWPIDNFNLSQFKLEVIEALRRNVNEWLAIHAQDLENNGHLTWQVAIKNGGAFAAVHNQLLLPENNTFERFLDAAGILHESKMKTCTLVQEDPKVVAQNERAFRQLRAHHAPDTIDPIPTREPTAGATAGAALHELMREIYAAHDPCERLSHLPEAPVCINPEDPNEYFVLTTFKADAWARAIRNNPAEVTTTIPPRGFTYRTGPVGTDPPEAGPSNRPAPPRSIHQAPVAPSAPDSVTETGVSTESGMATETRNRLIQEYILQQAQSSPPLPAYHGYQPYPLSAPALPAYHGYPVPHHPWYPQHQHQPLAHPAIPPQPSMLGVPAFTPAFPGQAFRDQAFPGQAFPGQPYEQAFPPQPAATNQPPQETQTVPEPAASPAPSDHGAPIEDFIRFAQLGPNPTLVIDGLNQLGITHWTLLQHVTPEELINTNIPIAQARALMIAFKRYPQHLKKLAGASSSH
ncbi:hypothetical protein KEM48_011948 [Puccinia striiformis f. sp. tritici PST-130]|nr:hypothetical protein KEM48_011948 [Puccinia striiformis f. sp. tritici PST-130]